jgi:hypothetical protein
VIYKLVWFHPLPTITFINSFHTPLESFRKKKEMFMSPLSLEDFCKSFDTLFKTLLQPFHDMIIIEHLINDFLLVCLLVACWPCLTLWHICVGLFFFLTLIDCIYDPALMLVCIKMKPNNLSGNQYQMLYGHKSRFQNLEFPYKFP